MSNSEDIRKVMLLLETVANQQITEYDDDGITALDVADKVRDMLRQSQPSQNHGGDPVTIEKLMGSMILQVWPISVSTMKWVMNGSYKFI